MRTTTTATSGLGMLLVTCAWVLGACGGTDGAEIAPAGGGGGDGGGVAADGGGVPTHPNPPTGGDDAGATANDGGDGAVDASGGDAGVSCFHETVHPTAPIDDLAQAFTGQNWLSTSLDVLTRRYPAGDVLLDAMRNDPYLAQFADTSSFSAQMTALMTQCHEMTHRWNGEQGQVGKEAFYMGDLPKVLATEAASFPRAEIATEIQDDVTKGYDDTYLTGQQGQYGFEALTDELSAYINGLGCIAAVGDKATQTISARDGSLAHLFYVEVYLRIARTKHAAFYDAVKADPDWQRFLRQEWARARFWDGQSLQYAHLGIDDAKIRAKVDAGQNLDEMRRYFGQDPAAVACTP